MHQSELRAKSERENLAADYREPLPGSGPDLYASPSYSVKVCPDSIAFVCLHQPWYSISEATEFGSVDGRKECLRWTPTQFQDDSGGGARG